jgi:hypothetical protein
VLTIVMTVFGFLAPLLPEVLKWLNRKADYTHELAMFKLRMEAANFEHTWRMEEITAHADIEEAKQLHKPMRSYGIDLLDKADDNDWPRWVMVPAFWAFVLLDWLAGMVRPAVTYAAFAFYIVFLWARFQLIASVSDDSITAWEIITTLYGENDMAILHLVLSYWFGHRAAKQAFGGSALNNKRTA